MMYCTLTCSDCMTLLVAFTRSVLIHFACIGVAPPRLVTRRDDQSRGTTPTQAKWIILDLHFYHLLRKYIDTMV